MSARPVMVLIALFLFLGNLFLGILDADYLWWLILTLPLFCVILYDASQKSNNVLRNFPIVGHIKQVIVKNRDLLQDWALENNRDGRPFSWIERKIVYSRAENAGQTTAPFGTQYNVYAPGFEWVQHSVAPAPKIEGDLRIMVGGPDCTQPYSCSILNVSAMSYGSISKNATMALNGGAKLGNFASNTGEGGLSEYHLRYGGDLIFQLGTGYFGCRNENGGFNEEKFAEAAKNAAVKMIEIKISQGAKPGYGAILPAKKVTKEIAGIREIQEGVICISPAGHSEFNTPTGLLLFVKKLRVLSGGKPIGFKLCLGKKSDFFAICKGMVKTGIKPDFITIDGKEGGTGAAHFESLNWVGMPIDDSLPFIYNALTGFDLKKDIKLFACGRVVSGFHFMKLLALGADACYSARGMMFALGCVQALQCNEDTCPTGVTTMNESLMKGLVVEDKKLKVKNFHENTIISVKDMMAAAGLTGLGAINRSLIARRLDQHTVKSLDELYPNITAGSLLGNTIPEEYKKEMEKADAESF